MSSADDVRVSNRLPVALRIRLKYPDVEAFIERFSVNLSRGGIFIASRSPRPVGTLLRFEFQLSLGEPVVRGEGEVIWVREFDPDQPTKPHGMGVRFTSLDAESRAVVDRALTWREQHQASAHGGFEPSATRRGPVPPSLLVGTGEEARTSADTPTVIVPLPSLPPSPSPPAESRGAAPTLAPRAGTPPPPPLAAMRPRRTTQPPEPPSTPIAGLEQALARLANEAGITEGAVQSALQRARGEPPTDPEAALAALCAPVPPTDPPSPGEAAKALAGLLLRRQPPP